jgi:hypothetical protein
MTRIALVVALAVLAVLVLVAATRHQPAPVASAVQPVADPLTIDVRRADDEGKPGDLRSVMGQRTMYQAPRTSGPSPDTLRFRFDAPVEVVGMMLSVDISGPELVEFAVGVNTPAPYGLVEPGDHLHREFIARDWLMHVSDANGGRPSKIDEAVWFPGSGFALDAGEYLALDAWLLNQHEAPRAVSPEWIVYYRWATAA